MSGSAGGDPRIGVILSLTVQLHQIGELLQRTSKSWLHPATPAIKPSGNRVVRVRASGHRTLGQLGKTARGRRAFTGRDSVRWSSGTGLAETPMARDSNL
ncbi:hypothetical protein E2562_015949 [Oryza meyeriana var. granulata]|uniref:Uncharacterized protein n=1 Tax=Oryza meyeriana var. granulata TaxID=110450 RepID=A0A6G1CHQ2_9ORYZ|nr:hypothetical protein E2562_015949 [Oryza meyeriana var. granulata]